MEIKVSKRFSKELKKAPENIQNQVRDLLKIIKNAEDKDEIPDIKILKGFKEYYRIRLGGWRVGVKIEDNNISIWILTIAARVLRLFTKKNARI